MGSQSVKAQTTAAAAAAADHAVPEQQWHAAATAADEEAGGGSGPHLPPPTRLKSTVRPTLPLERGMSARFERLEQRQPRLYRSLALAALTTAFACGFVGQISAPGLVDPSIVQLVSLFQVVFIALVQAALLRHKLPWALWPAAALMIGSAAMVIVPSMSQSAAGSLNSAKGWAGFGLSATRHLGFSPWNCQYLYMGVTLVLLLCLSLPVNGTHWAADLSGWSAADWSVLALLGSVINVGTNLTMQHAIWQLGAPTVAMFVGLRLVCAVVLSKIVLGATTIKTAVQVVGICLTAATVTAYMAWQWKRSAKPAPAPAEPSAQPAAAAAAEPVGPRAKPAADEAAVGSEAEGGSSSSSRP
ncbi:hypothetical protein COHA_010531 [Chlorella ohadii]|uniref:Uncharacterized protein n=1 Tax=Chlorella ohadii TaxID=2649997 RepID=A0AAD5DCN7_9CHLO|nr:hypothetical protein COHA_010531 [Chlorella ohadii]